MDLSGTKNVFDFSNIDYDTISTKMNEQMKAIMKQPIRLFWNSHTGETYPSGKFVSSFFTYSDENTHTNKFDPSTPQAHGNASNQPSSDSTDTP